MIGLEPRTLVMLTDNLLHSTECTMWKNLSEDRFDIQFKKTFLVSIVTDHESRDLSTEIGVSYISHFIHTMTTFEIKT